MMIWRVLVILQIFFVRLTTAKESNTTKIETSCKIIHYSLIQCDHVRDFLLLNNARLFLRFEMLELNNCAQKPIDDLIENNDMRDAILHNLTSYVHVAQEKLSRVSFNCNMTQFPRDVLKYFHGLRYIDVPYCNITKLQWQTVFFEELIEIDLKTCPIECSCEHKWLMHGTNYNRATIPDVMRGCRLRCDPGTIEAEKSVIHASKGDNITVRVKVQDQMIGPVQNRNYFIKAGSLRNAHDHDEIITKNTFEMNIYNVSASNLAVFGARCWHCVDYLLVLIDIRVDVPPTLEFQRKQYSDTDNILVTGYPLDNVSLAITNPDNITETRLIGPDHEEIVYFNCLVITPRRSIFYQISLKLTSRVNPSFPFHFGDMVFTVCSAANCTTITKYIDHFGIAEQSTTEKPESSFDYNIIFTIIILLLIILLIILMIFKRRQLFAFFVRHFLTVRKHINLSNQLQDRRTSLETEETLLRLEERSSLSSSDYTNQIIPFIDIGKVEIHEKIGRGAFGEVYCGSWEKLGERSVAVKIIKEADTEVEKEALVLSRLDHPNIVRLFGMTRDKHSLLLVFEMMNLGDLRTYLRGRAPQATNYSQFPPALVEKELKRIIVDIIRGVCYLVAQQIVHRDLAARNCLVSGKSDLRTCSAAQRPPIVVKISDFGMSRRLYSDTDYYRMEHNSLLPIRWLPPEAITSQKFSHMSDVWSLGVTMWEVFSYGQVPFSDLSNQEVVSYAMAGVRPIISKSCPPDMYELMCKCWEVEPEKRIPAEEILLHQIFEDVMQERVKTEEKQKREQNGKSKEAH